MVFYKAMKQRVSTNRKSQRNHTPFKKKIVNNINAKKRKTAQYQRQ